MSRSSVKHIRQIPLGLGVITLFGLLAALLGTGVWYWLAWIAMTMPLVVILISMRRSKQKSF